MNQTQPDFTLGPPKLFLSRETVQENQMIPRSPCHRDHHRGECRRARLGPVAPDLQALKAANGSEPAGERLSGKVTGKRLSPKHCCLKIVAIELTTPCMKPSDRQ